jgi:pterin-4a-carbinolamine dehydratase
MTKQEGSVQTVKVEVMEKSRRKPAIERLLDAFPDVEERLKAERVEQFLKLMPDWQKEKGSRAISRLREFPDVLAAAKYAAYVQDYAGSRNVAACTLRWNSSVLVTLFGPRRRQSFDSLTPGVLRFALSLG